MEVPKIYSPKINYQTQVYQNNTFDGFKTITEPQNDETSVNTVTETKKRLSTDKKIGIGILVSTAIAIGGDYLLAKGKHVKSILNLFNGKTKAVQEKSQNVIDDAANIVREAAETTEKAVTTTQKAAKQAEKMNNPFYAKANKAVESSKNGTLKYDVETVKKQEALKKAAEEAKSKVENASNGIKCKISQMKDGKTYNIHVENGKTKATSNCYLDEFTDIYGYNTPGYVDKNGTISGLYLNNLNSSGGGMGTEAVKETILLSKKLGQEGRIYLHASITDKVKGSPIPFYNKIGFKAMDKSVQKEIEKGMQSLAQNGVYTGPVDTMMYLPLENIPAFLSR